MPTVYRGLSGYAMCHLALTSPGLPAFSVTVQCTKQVESHAKTQYASMHSSNPEVCPPTSQVECIHQLCMYQFLTALCVMYA